MSHKFSDEDALKLYSEGKSDGAIAAAFGVTTNTIFYWRKTHSLPTKNGPLENKKEEQSMAMQVPSNEALPEDLKEKVKDDGAAQGVEVDMDRMNRNAEQRTGPSIRQPEPSAPEVNKPVYLPGEYDPLVYDVFDLSIAKCYERGIQPGLIWRQLLRASEDHLSRLCDYLLMSEEACRCAVELAALAAAEAADDDT